MLDNVKIICLQKRAKNEVKWLKSENTGAFGKGF